MLSKGRLLIVDDEKLIRWSLEQDFSALGYEVDTAEDGGQALSKAEAEQCDVMLLDIRLPDITGIEVLRKLKQAGVSPVVIMMTANADIETAVEAMRTGAFDYVAKPFNMEEMRTRVERALETRHLKEEVSFLRKRERERFGVDHIIGNSRAMKETMTVAERVARTDATVLLLGESGTGKDVIARYIHFHSPRSDRPFMDVNCAALPESLLESELMGHEKGAFTDARATRKGLFEQAEGGTVFLDEIGDMPLVIQAKVLKLVETRKLRRLGGVREIETDVRIIAATNRKVKDLVKEGKMREDLYYRLSVVSLYLPPLRERSDDILLLASYFFDRFGGGRSKARLSPETEQLLVDYDWPGNVREMRNVVEHALIMSDGGPILPFHLPSELLEEGEKRTDADFAPLALLPDTLSLVDAERDLIKKGLAATGGNLSKAARILGTTRDTLRYRVKKLGISPELTDEAL